MRVMGMLAGVGTLLREAQDAGCTVIGNLETRPYFRTIPDVWHANFPDTPLITDAVRLQMMTSGGSYYEPDLMLGHPPCGSHSVLGVTHSLDLPADQRAAMAERRSKRVGLLPLFVEGVNSLQPKVFALDNLPKILEKVATKDWWKASLPDYRLTFMTIRNWDYGTPQMRTRLWVVGTRRDQRRFRFVPPTKRLRGPRTVWSAIRDLPWEPWKDLPELAHVHAPPSEAPFGSYPTLDSPPTYIDTVQELAHGYLSLPPAYNWPYRTRTTNRITKKFGRARLRLNGHSSVISSGTLQHPITGWTLTARERARIMDWPDDFKLWDGSRIFTRSYQARLMIFTGKAVPSRFPRYLIPQLLECVK